MIEIDRVVVRAVTVTSVEVTWILKPTDEPLSSSRFTVLMSESEQGPFEDVSGPLTDTQTFVCRVNLKAKHNTLCWRIRVDDVITGISTTYPNGTPTEAFRFHPLFDVVTMPSDYGQSYIAIEIARRNNLLLRRFTGRLTAYLPLRTQGKRCPQCWDEKKRRGNSSSCVECYGTTFQGGFYTPIPVFVDFNPSPNVIQISSFGKMEENQTAAFMGNYPLVKPNDMLVEQTNRRWRVVQVNAIAEKRYIVQQHLQVQEIERSDAEYLLPVDLNMKAPTEDFVGFFPKNYSPKLVPTEGSGLL